MGIEIEEIRLCFLFQKLSFIDLCTPYPSNKNNICCWNLQQLDNTRQLSTHVNPVIKK